jgi:hypothetical protein
MYLFITGPKYYFPLLPVTSRYTQVVKSTTELVTIWERNFQLGCYSLLMYGGIILYTSYSAAQASVAVGGAVAGVEVARLAWSNWTW